MPSLLTPNAICKRCSPRHVPADPRLRRLAWRQHASASGGNQIETAAVAPLHGRDDADVAKVEPAEVQEPGAIVPVPGKFTVWLIDADSFPEKVFETPDMGLAIAWVQQWLAEPLGLGVAIFPPGLKPAGAPNAPEKSDSAA